MTNDFQLSSSAFIDGSEIPQKYTCKGPNISPPLEVHGVPEGAASLALIMHDPDAPNGDFLHWTIWNLQPGITTIGENAVPAGVLQGVTDFGKIGYGGPCPPAGTHRYEFEFYALGTELDVRQGATRQELQEAMSDHIIAQTKLTGTASA